MRSRQENRKQLEAWSRLALVILSAWTATGLVAAEPVPYGSADFYPSPQRPVGFMGDGNSYYPGATPVAEWRDGTPAPIEIADHRGKKGKSWTIADEKAVNIVWKIGMPSWANSQPTVIGDRVVTYGEPDLVICTDANDGRILWTTRVNPWVCTGVEPRLAEKLQTMADIGRSGLPPLKQMTNKSTVERVVPPEEWDQILPPLKQQVMPRIVKALHDLDPSTDWAAAAATSLAELDQHIAQLRGGATKTDRRKLLALEDTIKKRIEQLGGINVPLHINWGHMVGGAMNAPVSDGRHIFVSFGYYGQTACLDLDGKILWGRWFEDRNRTPCQSGLLSGDIYVDMHGQGTLRGLDKRSGRTVWEAPTNSAELGEQKGGYYVGSHKIVTLGDTEVLVTTMCNIIRPSDGRVLGVLPWPHNYGPSGGPSIFNSGNIVYRAANGDGGGSPFTAYRLKTVSSDKVAAEILYSSDEKGSPGYQAQVATPDFAVLTASFANIIGAESGAVLAPSGRNNIGGLSNTLAGNGVFIWAEEGSSKLHSRWGGRRREDGRAFAIFRTADLRDPSAPKMLSDSNILDCSDWPRQLAMEQWAPELYAVPCYAGQAYGKVSHGLHTDNAVVLSGNRIFIRTVGSLYCIGDPKQPYDWNPESRPEDITKSLSKR